MRLIKVIHGYPLRYNAGSEVYSQSICQELSKNHKVNVFTREENPYKADFSLRKEKVNGNLDVYFINNPNGKDGYRHEEIDRVFNDLVQELDPEVAHIGHLNHLSTGIVAVLYKRQIPIVYTLHDFWLMCPRGQFLTRSMGQDENHKVCDGQQDHKCATTCYSMYFSGKEEQHNADSKAWASWIKNRMEETQSIVSKVDLFIAPSQYLRNRFINEFSVPAEKIKYLDYGFPTEYLTPSFKAQEKSEYTFGYIGTLIPAKGVNLLIEAFKSIAQPARLLIFGRQNGQATDALKSLAKGSLNPIEFAGEYINHNLADDVFSKVDCIVVPSIWAENSPLVIHEAQACKIPVITADYGGMRELVAHQVNGLLFRHRDIASLKEQLNYAIQNPSELVSLGQRGYLNSDQGLVPDIRSHCLDLEKIYSSIEKTSFWRITLDTNPEDCNLQCIMCEEHSPYSTFKEELFQKTGVKRRRMDFSLVQRLFKEAKELGIKEIIPSTMGEPLLYKGIEGLFELSQETGIKINLTTNGTFIKKSVKEWADIIVPNTTDVKISWNGSTKLTSELVMKGLKYEKALSNLQEFVKYRNEIYEAQGWYCSITLQLTFMKNNMHELADVVRFAAKNDVDRVKGHHLWAHFDEIKDLSMEKDQASIDQWNFYVGQALEAQDKYRRSNGQRVRLENITAIEDRVNEVIPESYDCPFLGRELWVSATGKISPCCAPDKERQQLGDFGNVNDTSLSQVISSPAYQSLMKDYKSRSLCMKCKMRRPV